MTDQRRSPTLPVRGRWGWLADRPATSSTTALCVWSLLLAALLLGPALGPGFVLSYDLVWVPDLALRPDFLGVGSALPRAVPSDAVVAVLDEVVPGAVLEKIVLLGSLAGGGCGMARLLAAAPLPARWVATTSYVWSPLVVERLVMGAWPVLLGYAVLPWILLLGRRWRESGTLPLLLPPLVALGSLSASAGLVTIVACTAVCAQARLGRWLSLAAVLLTANAPWMVAGLLHLDTATSDPLAAPLFALADEGSVPGPLAALTGGGIWNTEVVPDSRTGLLGLFALVLVVVLGLCGLRSWALHTGRRDAVAWAACWVVGWGLATLSWAAPEFVGTLAGAVPGGGLLRDGSRILVLTGPLTAAAVGCGAAWLAARVPAGVPRALVAGLLVVWPLLLMPDAAWGVGGRLGAVDYPASYVSARESVREEMDRGRTGDVLLLPLASYRQPAWNDDVKVLDPVGRYLTPDFVTSDELIVSGRTLTGEDPRIPQVRAALERDHPTARSAALAEAGIGFVTVDRTVPVPVPRLAGEVLVDEPDLWVLDLAGVAPVEDRATPAGWVVAMAIAWMSFLICLLSPGWRALGRRFTDRGPGKR